MMSTIHDASAPFYLNHLRQNLLAVPLADLRYGAVMLAIILYACAGSPTPDSVAWPELIVAVLLGGAICNAATLWIFQKHPQAEIWAQAGRIFLFWGMSIAVLWGIAQGHSLYFLMRDVIWVVFAALPVLLWPLFQQRRQSMPVICVMAGLVLSAREMLRLYGGDLSLLGAAEATYYLGNSPLVLFAAIMLAGMGAVHIMARERRIYTGLVFMILSCLPLFVMAAGMQRASIGLFFLSMIAVCATALIRAPYRALPFICILLACGYLARADMFALADMVWMKTAQVGLMNMRTEEWGAVWAHIADHPIRILLGTGWGGVYQSPAVGGMSVNFTHGALSSALLKGGFAGLVVIGGYLFVIGRRLVAGLYGASDMKALVFGLALLCPFVTDVLLYGSFKSFDFGVLLVMIVFAPKLVTGFKQQNLVSSNKSH
tara:strand:- start:109 stop:1398 length:1290 start_codon:yes stop_codon:yes gene_type:complete